MEESIIKILMHALALLQDHKPNDRSEKDRHYAIVITELEKVYAYYKTFIDTE